MKNKRQFIILLFIIAFFSLSNCINAQNGINAFGIQFKPIVPLGIVNTDGQVVIDEVNNTRLEIKDRFGYGLGAVIRLGFTKRFSFETGINVVQRNYDFSLTALDFGASSSSLRFTGYEIPAIGMVFVQLDQQLFMNAAGGVTFDLFPTGGVVNYDRDTIEYGILESNWLVPALSANLGFEYRTKEHGYFYIGSSYHLPFKDIATVYVSYRESNSNSFKTLVQPQPKINGAYLTLDIRYFFNSGMKEKIEK